MYALLLWTLLQDPADLVAELANDDAEARDAAMLGLIDAGDAADAAILKGFEIDDLEVRERLFVVVRARRAWGVFLNLFEFEATRPRGYDLVHRMHGAMAQPSSVNALDTLLESRIARELSFEQVRRDFATLGFPIVLGVDVDPKDFSRRHDGLYCDRLDAWARDANTRWSVSDEGIVFSSSDRTLCGALIERLLGPACDERDREAIVFADLVDEQFEKALLARGGEDVGLWARAPEILAARWAKNGAGTAEPENVPVRVAESIAKNLRSPSWPVQAAAAQALRMIPRAAAPQIRKAYASENVDTARLALWVARQSRTASMDDPEIARRLRGPSLAVREAALLATLAVTPPEKMDFEAMLDVAPRTSGDVRETAAMEIRTLKELSLVKAVASRLTSDETIVREFAWNLADAFEGPDAEAIVCRALFLAKDPALQARAVELLGRYSHAIDEERIVYEMFIPTADRAHAETCMKRLTRYWPKEGRRRFEELLKSPKPRVRERAVEGLAIYGRWRDPREAAHLLASHIQGETDDDVLTLARERAADLRLLLAVESPPSEFRTPRRDVGAAAGRTIEPGRDGPTRPWRVTIPIQIEPVLEDER